MQLSRSLSSIDSGAAGEKRRMKPFAGFRLVETKEESEFCRRSNGPTKQVSTRFAEAEDDRQKLPRMLPAAFSSAKDDVLILRPRKKSGCLVFSRILKLILRKKTRKPRQKADPKFKTQDSNAENQQFYKNEDSKIISNTFSSSTAFPSPSFSSCSSSPAHDSRSSSDLDNDHNELPRSNPRKSDQTVEERPQSRSWLWLLLISLSCLILWGKICASWCSMAWLFFFLHRRTRFSAMKKKNSMICTVS